MYLRDAQPTDEPLMAAICTRAFFDDDLFGRVIHPQRSTYRNDVQIYWHEWLRQAWSCPRSRLVLAVAVEDQQERIVGVAIWERQGDDEGAQRASKDFKDPGPWPKLDSTQNRALDPSKKTILHDSEPYWKPHYWVGSCAINWFLALCCVDPTYQKNGYGNLLTGWGLERAKKEGIRASVIASEGTTEFYMKCGFKKVVGNASEGEGNPMAEANVKGGDILFT
ncbi:hypothetical protein EKO04_009737 [Ascochyta lentis]|uniref:N-acetyltransferase domain-containing protein n=1 Tax=Ascochyta lentis TaxID=205686 RepID=A0A8H7MDZ0_9PLEO|nr:hypothetical protein EKO04_009737 [Ascochyta lentis]